MGHPPNRLPVEEDQFLKRGFVAGTGKFHQLPNSCAIPGRTGQAGGIFAGMGWKALATVADQFAGIQWQGADLQESN
jgi:hypothetical protein